MIENSSRFYAALVWVLKLSDSYRWITQSRQIVSDIIHWVKLLLLCSSRKMIQGKSAFICEI